MCYGRRGLVSCRSKLFMKKKCQLDGRSICNSILSETRTLRAMASRFVRPCFTRAKESILGLPEKRDSRRSESDDWIHSMKQYLLKGGDG